MISFPHEILDVLFAFLLGAVVGAEREWRRHPGGLRSCAIVAAASSGYVRLMIEMGGNNLSAGLGALITGVGFLGAGVILHRCGARQYHLTFALFLAVALSHVVLRMISTWIDRHAPPDDLDGPH